MVATLQLLCTARTRVLECTCGRASTGDQCTLIIRSRPSRALRMLRVCAFVRASKGLPGPPHARETSGNVCRHCIRPERDPERDPEGTWIGEIVLLRIPERALPTTWLLKNIVLNLTPKLAPAFFHVTARSLFYKTPPPSCPLVCACPCATTCAACSESGHKLPMARLGLWHKEELPTAGVCATLRRFLFLTLT